MSFISKALTKSVVFLLILSLLSPAMSPVMANNILWNKTFPEKTNWETMTSLGVIIAGTDNYILALENNTGELLWTKKIQGLATVTGEQVWPVDGTDIVLISDQTKKLGGIISNATLYAVEIMTGDVIWYASHVKGRTLDVIPVLDKNMVLYITDQVNLKPETLKDEPILPYVYAIDIHTGKVKWEREYEQPVEGAKLQDNWLGYKKFNLSSYYPPLALDNELYLFYSGIVKWDLDTGETIWKNTYSTGSQKTVESRMQIPYSQKKPSILQGEVR